MDCFIYKGLLGQVFSEIRILRVPVTIYVYYRGGDPEVLLHESQDCISEFPLSKT